VALPDHKLCPLQKRQFFEGLGLSDRISEFLIEFDTTTTDTTQIFRFGHASIECRYRAICLTRIQGWKCRICRESSRIFCNRGTSILCTGAAFAAARAAATPAACPAIMNCGSIRKDANATWDADMETGTKRLAHSDSRGVKAR